MRLTEILNVESNLNESENGALRMKVPFLTADEQTANKRTYPLQILKTAISELKKKLAHGMSYGSTAHPKESLEVNDVSHQIEDVTLEGKTAVATIKILPTSRGRNLLAIIRAGGKVGVSARGLGEVQNEGGQEIVKSGYQLQGLDFVLNPAQRHFVGMEQVLESAPVGSDDENEKPALTEDELKRRYEAARREAGYRGTWEQYCSTAKKEK